MQRNTNILKTIDWLTISLYLVIVILGWINLFATVYNEEHSSIIDFTQQYGKQFIWILTSLIIALIILFTDSKYLQLFSYPIYIIFLIITFLVLIFGKEINGQKAWFELGWLRIQPSEFMKFAIALALAKFMSKHYFKIHNLNNLLIISLLTLLPMFIVFLQKDTGTAIVFASFVFVLYREGLTPFVLFFALISIVLFITSLLVPQSIIIYTLIFVCLILFLIFNGNLQFFIIGLGLTIITYTALYGINHLLNNHILNQYFSLFVATSLALITIILGRIKKIKYAITIAFFLILSIVFTFTVDYIFNNVLEPHQQSRINELIGKSNDLKGVGYNVNQSKIAIGSGGFLGKGFLQGTQTKYNFVPEQSTDFIFCTVGEEHGFVGSSLLLILYASFLIRIIFIAERQRQTFSRIYGYGVFSVIFFHFVINIGMTISLVPVIGIPLPFFSYGGSSLWAFTILLFIFVKLDADRFKYLA